MRKVMSAVAVCGALFLGACDSSETEVAPTQGEVVMATAKNGDTVVIDFVGYMNDKQFEGGTGSGYPLKLGSGSFVPGFEEQLVGAKVGEKRDVKLNFPMNYYPELAGKEVLFVVTVKEIR